MATATPPIQLRNTYPPGQPAMSAAPKPLRRTPTGVGQIMFPDGVLATHFQGPLVSGPTPGVQGAAGSATLTLTLQIDWSQGDYSIPIQFPGGCFLQSLSAITYETGLGASVQLGTQQGGSDIGTVTLPAKGAVSPPQTPGAQLPVWDDQCPFCPFQAWLTVSGNTGATQGGAIVLITYVRLAAPWSSPATDYNRI